MTAHPVDGRRPVGTSYGEERLDVLFDVLSHRRRRLTLRFLRDRGDATAVDALVSYLVSEEGTATERSAPAERRTRVRTALEHQHLPKLAHADLVEWDRTAGTLVPTDEVGHVAELLDVVTGRADLSMVTGDD